MSEKLNILPVMERMQAINRDKEIENLNKRLDTPDSLKRELTELQQQNIITKEIAKEILKLERDYLITEIHAAHALINDGDKTNNGNPSIMPTQRIDYIYEEERKRSS